jgi:hypothetical protein
MEPSRAEHGNIKELCEICPTHQVQCFGNVKLHEKYHLLLVVQHSEDALDIKEFTMDAPFL